MGPKKKNPGQVSNSSTPGNSSNGDQASKKQLLADLVEEMKGTVTLATLVKENPI